MMTQVDRRPNECCNDQANLSREDVAKDHYVERCTCGRRHFVVEVDPVKFAAQGKGL